MGRHFLSSILSDSPLPVYEPFFYFRRGVKAATLPIHPVRKQLNLFISYNPTAGFFLRYEQSINTRSNKMFDGRHNWSVTGLTGYRFDKVLLPGNKNRHHNKNNRKKKWKMDARHTPNRQHTDNTTPWPALQLYLINKSHTPLDSITTEWPVGAILDVWFLSAWPTDFYCAWRKMTLGMSVPAEDHPEIFSDLC